MLYSLSVLCYRIIVLLGIVAIHCSQLKVFLMVTPTTATAICSLSTSLLDMY